MKLTVEKNKHLNQFDKVMKAKKVKYQKIVAEKRKLIINKKQKKKKMTKINQAS